MQSGLESTLVKIINNKLEILRPGKINILNIRKFLPYIENIKVKSNKNFLVVLKTLFSTKNFI